MTQQDLSEITGVNRATIGNYERDARIPNILILEKLCSALDVHVNEVFDIDSPTDFSSSRVDNIKSCKYSLSSKSFIVDKLLELGFDLDVALDKADLDKQEYNNLTAYRSLKLEELLTSIGFSDNKIKELLEE